MSRIEISSKPRKYDASDDSDDSIKKRPLIIPIFLPHMGCPHQCVFCNQQNITGTKSAIVSPSELESRINAFLNHKTRHRGEVQIAFFGGNFLGLEKDSILSLLDMAERYVKNSRVEGIRFSTRPDTINEKNMYMVKKYSISVIEIGAQSMDNKVLQASGRGHTSSDTLKAVRILKKEKYQIGIQMMVGLPEDSDKKSLESAKKIVSLEPDFIRIYPTLVFNHSPLAELYQKGLYKPMPMESCINLVKRLYLIFKENRIPVIRMGLQWSEGFDDQNKILAGPYHPAFGHLVHSKIFLGMASKMMDLELPSTHTIQIKVHPKSVSRMRGDKNENILALKKRYKLKIINVIPDYEIQEDDLVITQ